MSFNRRATLALGVALMICSSSVAAAQQPDSKTTGSHAKAAGSKSRVEKETLPKKAQDKKWKVGKIVKEAGGTPVWTDAKTAATEFAGFQFMGEYTKDGQALQVVPAEGRFYLSIYQGGLPGAGWDGGLIAHQWVDADTVADRVKGWEKVDRSVKLNFTPPPVGATILFDGKKRDHWKNGKVIDGRLQAGARTKKTYTDFKLHLEFMTPLKPTLPLTHPGRGNSGVFALGVYEVQVMDTFGVDPNPTAWQETAILKKPDTWCGSIYGVRALPVNVCLAPLSWQTLDINFTAAKFEGDKKTSDAAITVHLNGVLLHDHFALPSGTGGGPSGPRAEVPRGPIYLQRHGSPVQYRNVWMVE